MINRLVKYWVYGGALAGVLLLLLLPAIGAGWPLVLVLVYLQMPIYMLHQYEEHAGDRFRLWVNNMIGHGRDVLTPIATFSSKTSTSSVLGPAAPAEFS